MKINSWNSFKHKYNCVVVVVEDDKHKQVLFLYYGGGRKSDVSMFICAQC